VSLDIRQSADDRPRYTLYVVTGLAGMITLSTSLMGFAPVLVSAREGGMFKMYRLFPMWRGTVLLVWITSRLILTLLATVLMFALAGLLYKLQIAAPFAYSMAAIALLAVGVFAFLSVGLLIATWSASVSTATMLANLLYFPLLFSGNVMIPVSGLPGSVRSVLEYFPLNALVANMRDLLNGSFNLAYFIYTAALLITLSTACLYRSFRDSQWLARG
jgi:ABC-type polysaccharide/polyol phosphate export permease